MPLLLLVVLGCWEKVDARFPPCAFPSPSLTGAPTCAQIAAVDTEAVTEELPGLENDYNLYSDANAGITFREPKRLPLVAKPRPLLRELMRSPPPPPPPPSAPPEASAPPEESATAVRRPPAKPVRPWTNLPGVNMYEMTESGVEIAYEKPRGIGLLAVSKSGPRKNTPDRLPLSLHSSSAVTTVGTVFIAHGCHHSA